MLHRDVLKNNIITKSATDSKGNLISLGLVNELDSVRSGGHYRTETMQSMAIEVLLGMDDTYWHDLESFFTCLYGCVSAMGTTCRRSRGSSCVAFKVDR